MFEENIYVDSKRPSPLSHKQAGEMKTNERVLKHSDRQHLNRSARPVSRGGNRASLRKGRIDGDVDSAPPIPSTDSLRSVFKI